MRDMGVCALTGMLTFVQKAFKRTPLLMRPLADVRREEIEAGRPAHVPHALLQLKHSRNCMMYLKTGRSDTL